MLSKGLKRKREEEREKEALAVDSWWLDPSLPAVAQAPRPWPPVPSWTFLCSSSTTACGRVSRTCGTWYW